MQHTLCTIPKHALIYKNMINFDGWNPVGGWAITPLNNFIIIIKFHKKKTIFLINKKNSKKSISSLCSI